MPSRSAVELITGLPALSTIVPTLCEVPAPGVLWSNWIM